MVEVAARGAARHAQAVVWVVASAILYRLRELRPLAGLLQTGLLALLHARVAREEAAPLELGAKVGIGLDQRPRDAVPERAGLGGDAAAVHAGDDVHPALVADLLQRLADVALEGEAREVLLERAPVDHVGAGAGLEDHARDGGLALAGRRVARAGGEVDRRVGDRLRLGLVGVVALLAGLLVALLAPARLAVVLLADDVDLEVGAGDLGLDARGLVDLLELVLRLVGRGRGHGLRGLGRRRPPRPASASSAGASGASASAAGCSSAGVSGSPPSSSSGSLASFFSSALKT